jgi:cell division protein FtsL
MVFALLIVGFTVVFVAGAQALVTQSSIRISELEEQAERLATRSEILRLRVADLSSPDNIVRVAEDAGLVTPTAVRILRLSESSEGRATAGSNGTANEDALALKEGSGGSG